MPDTHRAELARWRPSTSEQRALLDDFVSYADVHPDAWSRECRPDHLTASALVLNRAGTHVLLTLHGKVGRWLQFGGHIDSEDESLQAAALRETIEESGLRAVSLAAASPLRVDRHRAPCGARYHLDVQYLAVSDELASPTVSAESTKVEWFAVDALPDTCDASVRALLADALLANTLLANADSPRP